MRLLIPTLLISVVSAVEVFRDLRLLLSSLASSPQPVILMLCQERLQVSCSEFRAVFSQIPLQFTISDRLVFFEPRVDDFSYLSYLQVKRMPQSLLLLRGKVYYLDVDSYSNRLLINFVQFCKLHPDHPHRLLRSEPFTLLDSFRDIFSVVDDSIYFFCTASRACISFVRALLAVLLAILLFALSQLALRIKSAAWTGDRLKKSA